VTYSDAIFVNFLEIIFSRPECSLGKTSSRIAHVLFPESFFPFCSGSNPGGARLLFLITAKYQAFLCRSVRNFIAPRPVEETPRTQSKFRNSNFEIFDVVFAATLKFAARFSMLILQSLAAYF
jgi:hypothetical protein